MVECEDITQLINFYQKNGFTYLQKNGDLKQFIKNFYI